MNKLINDYNVKKKAVVIGAGLGGLICATKLAKEGLDVAVLEQHDKVGGYGQAWVRKLTINGEKVLATFELTHAISGFLEGQGNRKIYEEMGVDLNRIGEFSVAPKFVVFRTKGEKAMEIPNDLEDFSEQLLKEYPKEAKGIRQFFKMLKKLDSQFKTSGFKRWLEDKVRPKIGNRLIPNAILYSITKPTVVRYRKYTFQQMLDKFFNGEKIKTHLSTIFEYQGLPPSKASANHMVLILLAYLTDKGGQAPACNSFQIMHEELEKALIEVHGGKVMLNSKVTEINVEENTVTGVQGFTKEKGGKITSFELKSDYVISAGDMKRTILPLRKLLPEDYVKKLEGMVMSVSTISVHAIVEMDLMTIENKIAYAANILASSSAAIELEGKQFPKEYILLFSVPTVLRPDAGLITDINGNRLDKYHIINIIMRSPETYEYWANLRKNRQEYHTKKEEYAQQMIGIVEDMDVIKGLREAIRFKEVATPITYERYCNTTDGALYTFEGSPVQFNNRMSMIASPIKGLYQTGASILAGGIGGAIRGGEITANIILKNQSC